MQNERRTKELEKGWIHHVAKWDTHNALIGKTQRTRRAEELAKGLLGSEALGPDATDGAEVATQKGDDEAWEFFKARLHQYQATYLAGKDEAVKEHLERLKEERSRALAAGSNQPLVSLTRQQPLPEDAARAAAAAGATSARPGQTAPRVTEDQAAALRDIKVHS